MVALVLLAFGYGFLIANLLLLLQYMRFLRRRARALLIWPSPRPPYFSVGVILAVVLGILVFCEVVILRRQAFGEGMMFLYYACLLPLSLRIRRGFYEDGIWADNAFIPYQEVGGVSWRETEHDVTLIVISRLKNLAKRLAVPVEYYGAARRLLRDKIARHELQFAGSGLDLGEHDERDSV
jgi:hypothetical protein